MCRLPIYKHAAITGRVLLCIKTSATFVTRKTDSPYQGPERYVRYICVCDGTEVEGASKYTVQKGKAC